MKINTCQNRKTVHPNDVRNIEDALQNLKRSISKLKPDTFNVDVKLPCEVHLDTALENIKQQQQLLNEKDKQIDHYRKTYIPISDKKKEFRAFFMKLGVSVLYDYVLVGDKVRINSNGFYKPNIHYKTGTIVAVKQQTIIVRWDNGIEIAYECDGKRHDLLWDITVPDITF
ncbi:unnamed protein product [Didymodactylos carnosus]|uniref:Uncharacterized protein n=1 Tax=Didymodactylos carnosus TaxID=1234261 RepID=A0A815N4T9_9BILA|nr:unnamed protein product [Didymodactylos carnosus]CAF4308533.1 unnamed protein product [Didymodactylos carnosus]